MRQTVLPWLALLLALVGSRAGTGEGLTADPVLDWKSQVEADWLTQDELRGAGPHAAGVTTRDDALGACDGIKNGRWGFHTGLEDQPWWQVDLGEVHALARVLVFNRADGGVADRASRMMLLISTDGEAWKQVYQHSGGAFYGATDGKPLSISLDGVHARFVRVRLPERQYLHLDEVEVYAVGHETENLALGKPADQSSVSQWSARHVVVATGDRVYPIEGVIERGHLLMSDLGDAGVEVGSFRRALEQVADAAASPEPSSAARRALYFKARWTVRELAFSNPLLDFDRILFIKRLPTSYNHMSDQYYGWWSRPGGGIYVLEGFKTGTPRARCLTESLPPGNFLRPDLSYDGERVLFAYCKYYPEVSGIPNKVDKERLPEDAFYHVFEMNVDGTGLRQLTRGRYDDFDARYLPNGGIVFLSTRRGQFIRCGQESAAATAQGTLPDSYVRCGGGNQRPVAVYTLHVMDADGTNMRAISPFENFEWTPSVASDGRILYARWDYVDRDNMPYISLWSIRPDGTNPQLVYGNFTKAPHCVFEARSVPGSRRLVFTASGHHSITGGSLVLLDPGLGSEGPEPVKRLTPEVCFPEVEGWPTTYYANPYPLSERYYLTAWSRSPLRRQGATHPSNALGLYLYDAFGNLELLYRDPDISSMYPIPLRPRQRPPVVSPTAPSRPDKEGRFLVLDVYAGLSGIERGTVKRLRIVGVPPKTQPQMNTPVLGVTRDDPGKFVVGTVPVEEDGSAYFMAPPGVPLLFQALDGHGMAVQTMRSLTHVQPGQTLSCVGCHEPRNTAPPNRRPLAVTREPSKITVGPEGSWPLRFDRLVQPVLDEHCVRCHRPDGTDQAAAAYDLTPPKSYESLVSYGQPSLREHVLTRYRQGRSVVGGCAARNSPLLSLLTEAGGHYGVRLDEDSRARLSTWMDTYAQRLGSFSADQEERLRRLRADVSHLLVESGTTGASTARTSRRHSD